MTAWFSAVVCVQGFLAGASAEIFGAGPVLLQLSKYPQPVLVVLALVTAGAPSSTTLQLDLWNGHVFCGFSLALVCLVMLAPGLWTCPVTCAGHTYTWTSDCIFVLLACAVQAASSPL